MTADNKSPSWDTFAEAIDLNARPPAAIVFCRRCLAKYPHPKIAGKGGSTSSMMKHLPKHEKEDLEKQIAAEKPVSSYFGPPTKVSAGISKEELNILLLHTLASCNWSFDQFDDPNFRYLFKRGFAGHQCPGRNGIKKLLTKEASRIREVLMCELVENESRVSLALDCWTSPNHWEFMGMTSSSMMMSLFSEFKTLIILQLICSMISFLVHGLKSYIILHSQTVTDL